MSTLGTLLRNAVDTLGQAGYVHAQREAEIILGHFSGMDTARLFTRGDDEAPASLISQVNRAVDERIQGRPLAYIVGTQSFLGWQLRIDERALIPRPETEQLVEFLVKKIRQNQLEHGRLLEVGTGSGAISIALKKYFPELKITATDISADALELAQDNAQTLSVDIDFIESDLLKNMPKKKYDIVVANLPYVPSERLAFVSEEILDWEPMIAIEAGEDGFRYIRALLESIKPFLATPALIALEMWHTHGSFVQKSVEQNLPNFEVTIEQDLGGYDRFAFIASPVDQALPRA